MRWTRQMRRLVLWTLAWTLFQWWAVIGWPDTLEGAHAALILVSSGSIVGLVGFYGLQRVLPRR
ncbi:MAG: hypothetical protein HY002_16110 [Candidatus Rokubacteria bacterium]|nr:hypothetical protein [Candidatus Rokubacteria bacterium]